MTFHLIITQFLNSDHLLVERDKLLLTFSNSGIDFKPWLLSNLDNCIEIKINSIFTPKLNLHREKISVTFNNDFYDLYTILCILFRDIFKELFQLVSFGN